MTPLCNNYPLTNCNLGNNKDSQRIQSCSVCLSGSIVRAYHYSHMIIVKHDNGRVIRIDETMVRILICREISDIDTRIQVSVQNGAIHVVARDERTSNELVHLFEKRRHDMVEWLHGHDVAIYVYMKAAATYEDKYARRRRRQWWRMLKRTRKLLLSSHVKCFVHVPLVAIMYVLFAQYLGIINVVAFGRRVGQRWVYAAADVIAETVVTWLPYMHYVLAAIMLLGIIGYVSIRRHYDDGNLPHLVWHHWRMAATTN